jgi:hypothetical protein
LRATLTNRKDAAIRSALVIACLTILPACAQEPDVGGVADVAGQVFQSDQAPLANSPVVIACIQLRTFDTATTDAHGHYSIALRSGFSGALNFCHFAAPDLTNPIAQADSLVAFNPSNEVHPVQIVNLLPVTPLPTTGTATRR